MRLTCTAASQELLEISHFWLLPMFLDNPRSKLGHSPGLIDGDGVQAEVAHDAHHRHGHLLLIPDGTDGLGTIWVQFWYGQDRGLMDTGQSPCLQAAAAVCVLCRTSVLIGGSRRRATCDRGQFNPPSC